MIQCDNKNISGEVDDDINFTYEPDTEVYGSCAATLDGEMFVLGGWNKKRQVNTKNLQNPDACGYLLSQKLMK